MIHLFKQTKDGAWKTKDGVSYDVKVAHTKPKLQSLLAGGYVKSLQDALKSEVVAEPEEGEDDAQEAELIAKIKELGGSARKGTSIETLEEKLASLQGETEE